MTPDPVFDIPAIERWGIETGIFGFMNSRWGWPTAESIHFIGLSLIIGTVGMFDLRLLGVARGVTLSALHKLVPFGVAGWLMAVGTGFLFVVSAPSQYLHNPAFQTKMAAMALAGLNMLAFYALADRAVRAAGPDELPPLRARLIGLISLTCWVVVIVGGRLITYFRPPYFWCLWCS